MTRSPKKWANWAFTGDPNTAPHGPMKYVADRVEHAIRSYAQTVSGGQYPPIPRGRGPGVEESESDSPLMTLEARDSDLKIGV